MSNLVEVEVNGFIYMMTPEDAEKTKALLERAEYLDKRQYLLKIQMNSLYGALSNPHFRYFDPRLGNSTTGTGRFVLEHITKTVGLHFDGKYEANSQSSIYGDTDSAYFATGASNRTEAIAAADGFAKVLNESMIPFMQDMFLCKGEYSRHVKTAREIVADRGIFVSKKMYMLHLIDKKGKESDEMKIMGLMLKKTLIPKQISRQISAVFEELLTGQIQWDGFNRKIIKLRDMMLESGDMKLLGSPKTVKDMEKYGDRLDRYVKADKIPGHVRAAAAYNKALRVFGDKENEPITSGTKIKLYYLKQPEGFNKAIALPTDIDPIPQWFIEHYWPKINLTKQFDLIFNGPIAQVLEALNRRVPTKNDLVADECLEF